MKINIKEAGTGPFFLKKTNWLESFFYIQPNPSTNENLSNDIKMLKEVKFFVKYLINAGLNRGPELLFCA